MCPSGGDRELACSALTGCMCNGTLCRARERPGKTGDRISCQTQGELLAQVSFPSTLAAERIQSMSSLIFSLASGV